MKDLTYLAELSEKDFETERCKLINAELNKLPPEERTKVLIAQMKIDQLRSTVPATVFIAALFKSMAENLENMQDQFIAIQHVAGKPPELPKY